MEKELINNNPNEFRGQYTYIAGVCGCHPNYVRLILSGKRKVKTERAEVAKLIRDTAAAMPKRLINN
ncbi:MAG: hypothetical protein RSC11_07080 [Mucinivorans sp.]